MLIRTVQLSDAAAIADIYNHYIENTIVTFEYDRVDASEIQDRIATITDSNFPWICCIDPESNELLGYAYAGPWRTRAAFRYVVESAIYLRDGLQGRGIGRKLYADLLRLLREGDFRSVIAGIAIPNEASIAAHQSMGFRRGGVFEKVGYKFDQWIDVEFWQLDL